jgi:hypothetical protein
VQFACWPFLAPNQVFCFSKRFSPRYTPLEGICVVAKQNGFGGEVQDVPKTAPSPAGPYKAELCTNYLHGGVIVLRVIEREIANLVLDLVRFNYVKDFGGNVWSRVLGADFRKT